MGDDYDDAGCLEIAQEVSHKYGYSFNQLATLEWGLRNRNLNTVELGRIVAGQDAKSLSYGIVEASYEL